MSRSSLHSGHGNMLNRFSDPPNGRASSRVQRPRYSNNNYNNNNAGNYNGDVSTGRVKSVGENSESKNGTLSEEKSRSVTSFSASSSSSSLSSFSSERSSSGNLDRFLESTTPLVPAQYLPKTCMKGWQNCDAGFSPYYTLHDLWDYFKEWSVYGVGVPLVLNGSDSVVQYYVPSLSAIQLYAVSSKPIIGKRHYGTESEASDGDYYRDTSSETSSDGEPERGAPKCNGNLHFRNHQMLEMNMRSDRLTPGDQTKGCQECSFSDDSEGSNSSGCLVFEYFEGISPFNREPLADKVTNLARNCPELKTLRSIDLLPASWMSVAWYPIYRIPTGPTLKDLDACFLTFHPLATPLKDACESQFGIEDQARFGTFMNNDLRSPKISLPVFGLASYKFRGATWTSNGNSERQRVNSLLQSADQWLRLLQVDHPDFKFFVSRSASNRR